VPVVAITLGMCAVLSGFDLGPTADAHLMLQILKCASIASDASSSLLLASLSVWHMKSSACQRRCCLREFKNQAASTDLQGLPPAKKKSALRASFHKNAAARGYDTIGVK
jgi:hypothetical protein